MHKIREYADCAGRGIQIHKAQEKEAEICRKKYKLYNAGKCKNCKNLKFKKGSGYGERDRICPIWDSPNCPHEFGLSPMWHILFSDGTDANLRGKTIQEVISRTSMEKIISIKRLPPVAV